MLNIRKSSKSDRKSSENRRHNYVHIICSLVRYQVKHSKRNSISTRTIVLSSIYFVRPKYSCMYSRCEMLSCSQTWYKALVAASAHVTNCVRYMLLLPIITFGHHPWLLSFVGKHRIIWQMDFIERKRIFLYGQLVAGV